MVGVWWTRIQPALITWVHPEACGSIPGRECLEAAFDAQLDFELSIIDGEEQTQIGTDYDKLFDTFDPDFMHSLHIAVGLPHALADIILYMYRNIQRRLKVGKHLGKPLVCNRGAGQGDTYAVLGAHFLTTIQFRHVSHECPTVKKSAVVDDRSFRGKCADAIKAVHLALKYDKLAGLVNNLSKFVAISTFTNARQRLREELFDDKHIRVSLEYVLVGTNITVRRGKRCALQDKRILSGIEVSRKLAKPNVGTDLKEHALMAASIT